MTVDAVVLAGGRSVRLGGVPKGSLAVEGRSLLERAVAAASGCQRVVVVGERMPGVLFAREDPPFGGPAAGIAAGIRALYTDGSDADLVLVLACDVPYAASAIDVLMSARSLIDGDGCQGLVAIDDAGRRQPLLALYSASALRVAIDRTDLHGLSVRALLADLRPDDIAVPTGSTDDIDTWADAERFGIPTPERTTP